LQRDHVAVQIWPFFAEVLLYRCGKMGGSCRPRGFREDDVERALRFVEAGVAGMAPTRN